MAVVVFRRELVSACRTAARVAIAGVALGAPLAAQVSPAGGEFQVNTYTTSRQGSASVAVDALGGFVVVWTSLGSGGDDSSLWSVQGQRFDGAGAPLGGEFQVNTYTSGSQAYATVATLPHGGFVVVWKSDGSPGNDSSSSSIQARRYAHDGSPLGEQFQVNTYTTGAQRWPVASAAGKYGFVVAWESPGSDGGDIGDGSVQARAFDGDGLALSGEIQVNTFTTGTQNDPAVAADYDGNFVVAWSSLGSGGTDSDFYSVQARRFAVDGTPLGEQFQVNTYTTSFQQQPAAAMTPRGEFVIAWSSYGSAGTDHASWSVQARRFSAGGVPAGDQFQANDWTTGGQWYPAVATDPRGNVVVAFQSSGSPGNDNDSWSVQGRRFGADGRVLDPQFQVNTWTTDSQQLPAAGVDALGNFVVAWSSFGSSGSDTAYDSVQAQRFDGILRDGFETGDTTRWSSTAP